MFCEKYWKTKPACSEGNQMSVDNDQCKRGKMKSLEQMAKAQVFKVDSLVNMNILQSREYFGFW